jgi:hypothetical protein
MRLRTLATAALMLSASIHPAAAQDDSLRATMRAFVKWMLYEDPDGAARFFPARGDWEWRPVTFTYDGPGVKGRVRIPPDETRAALSDGSRICDTFFLTRGAVAPGALRLEVTVEGREWRRLPGNRFVPPDAKSTSPVWLEWRREDDRWVVSAVGDRRWYMGASRSAEAPSTEIETDMVVRDSLRGAPLHLPLPDDVPLAAGAEWYESGRPIWSSWRQLTKYGEPRRLDPGDVVRYGTVNGAAVFVEPGVGRDPEVVYVAVARSGQFQPYLQRHPPHCGL